MVRGNEVTRVDAAMAVGAVSQDITISATAAALQTDRADVHTERA